MLQKPGEAEEPLDWYADLTFLRNSMFFIQSMLQHYSISSITYILLAMLILAVRNISPLQRHPSLEYQGKQLHKYHYLPIIICRVVTAVVSSRRTLVNI